MTVVEIVGNILNDNTDIICHQVNCKGIMGAGLAKQIRIKHYQNYVNYYKYCKNGNFSKNMLGNVLFYKAPEYIIANCFGQYDYGRYGTYTEYEAVKSCFVKIKKYALEHNLKKISIPFKMSCGLAGGKWENILDIINNVFSDSDLEIRIVKLSGKTF